MAERLCRHELCFCLVTRGREYCCRACAAADRLGIAVCPCLHPECRPEHARLYDPYGPGPLEPEDVRSE